MLVSIYPGGWQWLKPQSRHLGNVPVREKSIHFPRLQTLKAFARLHFVNSVNIIASFLAFN
ncbi:MAG: hypothetical protein ACC650_05225, partial [Gammaproteobacteria bacterium]